jgi:glycosyltransferase involved in cell wall biosynthesis
MRICYLADASSIHIKKWVSYFAAKGHEVHLISFEKGDIDQVVMHRVKMPLMVRNRTFLLKLAYIREIARLVKSINPQILHAFYATNYGFFASKSSFHPLILTVEGSDVLQVSSESRLIRFVKDFLARISLSRSDLITTDGFHLLNRLQKLGVHLNKVRMIQFGVDTKKFRPQPKSDRDELRVISLRSLNPIYSVDTLVKAIPLALRRFRNTCFVIAGTGTEEMALKRLVNDLGVTDKVRFVGQVANDLLPEYLNESDVYVSTSLSDAGLSMSTAEAMACGLPVVVTDNGDNTVWVRNGINGIVVKPGDHEMLAEGIISLLENPSMRKSFGKLNTSIVEHKDNLELEMNKMAEIYRCFAQMH